jgi:uracil-DNA glycosylase
MPARKYFPEDWVSMMGLENLNNMLGSIGSQLVALRETETVLPEVGDPLLFQAFRETPFSKVKCVILGQDCYHDGSFNGLAFGNGAKDEFKKNKLSPSLRNILAEVERTEGVKPNPNLFSWAYQGVLLINTAHSVKEGTPGGHLELWRPFTEMVITSLNYKKDLIWMLWGSKSQAFLPLISGAHTILQAGHPSPLNNTHPFSGCNCFQDCNKILKEKGHETIIWS